MPKHFSEILHAAFPCQCGSTRYPSQPFLRRSTPRTSSASPILDVLRSTIASPCFSALCHSAADLRNSELYRCFAPQSSLRFSFADYIGAFRFFAFPLHITSAPFVAFPQQNPADQCYAIPLRFASWPLDSKPSLSFAMPVKSPPCFSLADRNHSRSIDAMPLPKYFTTGFPSVSW